MPDGSSVRHKDRLAGGHLAEIGDLGQIGVGQSGAEQIDAIEVGTLEICPGQIRAVEIDLCQVGLGEPRALK